MKRLILFLAVFVLLAGSIASCQPAEPAVSGPATVRVLTMQQAGPTPEELNAIVEEFNAVHKDTEVTIDYVAYDALHDKIVTSMASNPPAYDVFLVDDIWFAEFAAAGFALDISDKITEEMREKIFEASWDVTTVGDKVYGMPWLLDVKYFYYNDKLLQEAGFTAPPTTWEELVSQAKVIKDKGIVEYPIVWSWAQAEAPMADLAALLFGNGGSFVDSEGKPAFNNAAGVEAVEWMVSTLDEEISNPASITYLEEDVRNVFSQGNAVYALNWAYMYDLANFNSEESQVTGQVKMSLVPVFQKGLDGGRKSATLDGSMGFAVAAKSPYRDAAWEFVKFLTSEDIQLKYSAHAVPIWQTAYEGDNLTKLQSSEVTKVTIPMFSEQFPFSVVRPKVPYYPEASKALQLELQNALTKQKSAQEALDAAAAKWEELAK